ncbi:hypothetical protein F2Q68_00020876 [Brassica cretica]|uniref:Uncharacterized protein n=1 Tax=Brassica cretica TaxID=69181 RepID=A0A8S9G1Z1_BRACR|nr:hypothetical protein F2Q68_00020876 [Brassica cretica]
MVTPIETKQETFRSRFEGEHKDRGLYVASGGLTGRYVASGRKPRRDLLVFVVKSQRKLRLKRNEKRYDEDSRTQRRTILRPDRSLRSDRVVCVLGRYIATNLGWSSVATSRPIDVCARSLRSNRAWLKLGRYVATEPYACSVAT